jgi:hypothetical protein
MPIRPASVSLEPALERKVAADLFDDTWTLLEKPDRTERETDLMVHAAHASRFMWEETARGEWQGTAGRGANDALARAHATAGERQAAARYDSLPSRRAPSAQTRDGRRRAANRTHSRTR